MSNTPDWKSPKPNLEGAGPQDGQKISIPVDVMDLIGTIVKDLATLKDVLTDFQNKDYGKAVKDLLVVVESIVVDMILPRLKVEKPADGEDEAHGHHDHDHHKPHHSGSTSGSK